MTDSTTNLQQEENAQNDTACANDEHNGETNHAAGAAARDNESASITGADLWNGLQDVLRMTWKLGKAGARYSGAALKRIRDVADDDVQAMAAELPLFALSTALPHSNRVEKKSATGLVQRPLVMIHGLGGSAGNVALLKLWVQLHSPRPVHVFGYGIKTTIDQVAADFEAWLMEVVKTYPDTQIDIIAHSMGGIIARSALQNPTLAQQTRRLLTLGSPHQGTQLARWGGSHFVTALRPDSPFVQRINTAEARTFEKENLEIVTFWSRRDVMVLPAENATLDGAWNMEMHESTHMSWMFKPRLMARIVDLLDAQDVGTRVEEYRAHDERVVNASQEAARAPEQAP